MRQRSVPNRDAIGANALQGRRKLARQILPIFQALERLRFELNDVFEASVGERLPTDVDRDNARGHECQNAIHRPIPRI
jgi:hypothetical protein